MWENRGERERERGKYRQGQIDTSESGKKTHQQRQTQCGRE